MSNNRIPGAWGVLPFENDNASDWVWSLEEAEDTSALVVRNKQ